MKKPFLGIPGMKMIISAFLTSGISLLLLAANIFAQAQTTTTTVTASEPVPQKSSEVGISAHDGITLSGAEVFITRNGGTEKLTKILELPNGMRVQPDGVIITRDGGKFSLRLSQVLTFDGKLLDAPIVESVAPAGTTTTVTTTTAPVVPTNVAGQQGVSKAAAEEAAQIEAQRRANSVNKGPIKAGEGVQK
jgi:hypothetical protein